MGESQGKSLIIGISSRALLDLEKENAVYDENLKISRAVAIQAFINYQREHQGEIIPRGVAFPLVKALLNLNNTLKREGAGRAIEVVIISRNHPDCGLRILNSLAAHGLEIQQSAFTGGTPVVPELQMFNVDLFLSYEERDVIDAAAAGISAAKIFGGPSERSGSDEVPLVAFDGDSCLFSNESDLAWERGEMEEFTRFEKSKEGVPLGKGPLHRFVQALADLHNSSPIDNPSFKMVLVTSRNFHLMRRPIETLRGWGIQLDKAYAIGRLSKQKILKDLNAVMFFDNDIKHCTEVAESTPTARVFGAGSLSITRDDIPVPAEIAVVSSGASPKNDFLLVCRNYLHVKKGSEEVKVLEQWFDDRVTGRSDDRVQSFMLEFEASVSGTPVGKERPAKDAKNTKGVKLIDFLDALAKKHLA